MGASRTSSTAMAQQASAAAAAIDVASPIARHLIGPTGRTVVVKPTLTAAMATALLTNSSEVLALAHAQVLLQDEERATDEGESPRPMAGATTVASSRMAASAP